MLSTVGHRRWGTPTNCPYAVQRRAASLVPRRAASPAPQLWRERWAAALTRLWQRAEQNRRVPFLDSST